MHAVGESLTTFACHGKSSENYIQSLGLGHYSIIGTGPLYNHLGWATIQSLGLGHYTIIGTGPLYSDNPCTLG